MNELGHLLFDPIQRLERVRVDTYQSNELDAQSDSIDCVEQRANAFAIAFLAPMDAVRDMIETPISIDSLESVMSKFGISHTASMHHVCNSLYRQFPLPSGSVQVGSDGALLGCYGGAVVGNHPARLPPARLGRTLLGCAAPAVRCVASMRPGANRRDHRQRRCSR